MSTLDHATAGRDRAARETLDPEQIKANGGAGDVGNAVQGADFVKMNLVQRQTMHRCLRLCQPAKDFYGQLALACCQFSTIKDFLHLRQESMTVLFLGFDSHIGGCETSLANLFDLQTHRQPKRSDAVLN